MTARKPKVRYVDFSPDEFLVGIAGMKAATIGVYWVACSLLYSSGGAILVDDERLMNLCGTSPAKLTAILDELGRRRKLVVAGGVIRNSRVDAVLERAQKRIGSWTKNLAGGDVETTERDQNADDLSSVSDRFADDLSSVSGEMAQKRRQNETPVSSDTNTLAEPRAATARSNQSSNHQPSTISKKEERETPAESPERPEATETDAPAAPGSPLPFPVVKRPDRSPEMFVIWRGLFHDIWPRATTLEKPRVAKLNARLNDTFGGDIERWREFCEQVRNSPYLNGENDRYWRAPMEWILQPGNISKIRNGNFDDHRPTTAQGYPTNVQRSHAKQTAVDAMVSGFSRSAGLGGDGTDDR